MSTQQLAKEKNLANCSFTSSTSMLGRGVCVISIWHLHLHLRLRLVSAWV
jgi:hypothetical protein